MWICSTQNMNNLGFSWLMSGSARMGKNENKGKAQQALKNRAAANTAAVLGTYKEFLAFVCVKLRILYKSCVFGFCLTCFLGSSMHSHAESFRNHPKSHF